jgi:hypothetical protein
MKTYLNARTAQPAPRLGITNYAPDSPKVWKRIALFLTLGLTFPTPVLKAQTRTTGYSVEVQAHDNFPNAIHFYCLEGYDVAKCKAHVLILRRELARYPIADLFSWSFFLVPSGIWEEMVRAAGAPAGTPAFTALHSRETFFRDALFSPTPLQRVEMMQIFRLDQITLFKLAVSHELAHALCQEANEQRASAESLNLQAGRAPRCR